MTAENERRLQRRASFLALLADRRIFAHILRAQLLADRRRRR